MSNGLTKRSKGKSSQGVFQRNRKLRLDPNPPTFFIGIFFCIFRFSIILSANYCCTISWHFLKLNNHSVICRDYAFFLQFTGYFIIGSDIMQTHVAGYNHCLFLKQICRAELGNSIFQHRKILMAWFCRIYFFVSESRVKNSNIKPIMFKDIKSLR